MMAPGPVNGGRRANMVHRQHPANGEAGRPMKIVVTGPFSAGKTTLIRTIADVAIVGTEREVTDETRATKTTTTVAMDFGRINFADGLSLYVFGTPGQRRFETVWEILSEGMLGFIVLVHAGDEASMNDAAHILSSFRRYADVPFVIGVTHLDQTEQEQHLLFTQLRIGLELPPEAPVVACDPRSKEDVKALLLHILFGVKSRLDRAESRNS